MNSQCTRCSGAHELADCPWPLLPESEDMPTPHKYVKMIKLWADGAGVQVFIGNEWVDTNTPSWKEDREYRIKPEPPAKVYPVSFLTWNEILQVIADAGPLSTVKIEFQQLVAIANAAIRDAIDHNQVVPMAEVQEVARNLAMKDREARDMAIAKAVFLATVKTPPVRLGGVVHAPDYKAIIASVKD